MYKIIRHYFNSNRRTIKTDLTLAEAQAHYKDSETSSRTCAKYADRQRTRHHGHWFDGYTECRR